MTQFEMMTSTESSGSGMFSISPFEELDVRNGRLPLVFTRERQHIVGHVQAVCFAGWTDAPCREQHVDPATGAKIEYGLSGPEIDQRGWVTAPEGCLDRFLRNDLRLIVTVKVCGDRIAAPKAGVTTCLHTVGLSHSARDACVLFLDLFLNVRRRFHDYVSSHTLKRMYSSLDASVKAYIMRK